MSLFFLFYLGVAVLVVLGAGALVYRHLRRRNRFAAALSGLLICVLLGLVWPIPMHGGFTFWGEIILDELLHQPQQVADLKNKAKQWNLERKLKGRFKAPLDVRVLSGSGGTWSEVSFLDGSRAWLEQHSGLIWSEPIAFESSELLMDLSVAKKYCNRQAPQGFWALPTEAERYYFWKAQGLQHLPHKVAPGFGYIVDKTYGTEVPSVTLPSKPAGNYQTPAIRPRQIMLRCVGLSSAAPVGGYTQKDIPLDEWNRYQLAK